MNNRLIKGYFDGCCEPINPGGTASYGAVIYEGEKRIWEKSDIFVPKPGQKTMTSNNVAEYLAFTAILEYLLSCGMMKRPILIFGDSKLVINQMLPGSAKRWKIRAGHYVPFAHRARKLVRRFKNIEGQWISRDLNDIADELSKRELRKAGVEFRIQPE